MSKDYKVCTVEKTRRIFYLLLLVITGFLLFRNSASLFNNLRNSNGNVFSAAITFPITSEPATVTPTAQVTDTITPTIQATVTEAVTYTPTPTATQFLADHIVFSEVQISGSSASQDFVELYNPTSSSVDIGGWKLRKRISSGTESSLMVIPAGKSIAAHGFFLWSNNANGYNTTVGADISNTGTITDDNSLALLKADNTQVDKVAWGSGNNQFTEGSPFVTNPGAGQSIERKGSEANGETVGNGYDSDNNSVDFRLRSVSQPQNTGSLPEIP